MFAEVKEGYEEGTKIIALKADSSDEANLLEKLFNKGIRVVAGSRWEIHIADPTLANLKAFYFSPKEIKIIHSALTHIPYSDDSMNLIRSMFPDV